MIDLNCLKQIAKEKRYTIASLERACGFSEGAIKRWAMITPGIDKVEKVADVLGCSIDELCGRASSLFFSDDQTVLGFINELRERQNEFTEDEQTVLALYKSLDDSDRVQVLSLLMRLKFKNNE